MSNNLHLSRRNFLKELPLFIFLSACGSRLVSIDELLAPSSTVTSTRRMPTTTPQPTNTLTPTNTPEPSPTPDTRTITEKYIYPTLEQMVREIRQERAAEDPYWGRIDEELNQNRINFALLGGGSERTISLTDSIQVMSLNIETNKISVIAFQRDMEAPEIKLFTSETRPRRINLAYAKGGFDLIGLILENASGLTMDYMIFMKMDVLSEAVEDVFGNSIEVCVPWDIYDRSSRLVYPAGLNTLSGTQVLQAARERYYASNRERNVVQQYIMRAILNETKDELAGNPLFAMKFLTKLLVFYSSQIREGNIQTNIDSYFFPNLIRGTLQQITESGLPNTEDGFGLPSIGARYGVETESADDPNDRYRLIAKNGNPNARYLVGGYWHYTRNRIKQFLEDNLEVITDRYGIEFESEVDLCSP